MRTAELIAAWEAEERQPFSGWDFSYLHGRTKEELPPLRYDARVVELMQRAQAALDLDTGGGECLLDFQPYWPARLYATEGYAPNLRLARERLEVLGVQVFELESSELVSLPFEDASFDLVLNRHGGCLPMREIARVLRPGATLLTQQVHGLTLSDLLACFGATPQWPEATPDYYLPRIADAGLALVDTYEYSGTTEFFDVGAVVYFLRAIPWLVPGFSVSTHTAALLALQDRLDNGERLRFITRGYQIEASHPLTSASLACATQPEASQARMRSGGSPAG